MVIYKRVQSACYVKDSLWMIDCLIIPFVDSTHTTISLFYRVSQQFPPNDHSAGVPRNDWIGLDPFWFYTLESTLRTFIGTYDSWDNIAAVSLSWKNHLLSLQSHNLIIIFPGFKYEYVYWLSEKSIQCVSQ